MELIPGGQGEREGADLTREEYFAREEALSRELEAYDGQWVRINNQHVVGSADTLQELTEQEIAEGDVVFKAQSGLFFGLSQEAA